MPYKDLENRRHYSRKYHKNHRTEILAKSKLQRSSDSAKLARRTVKLREKYGLTDTEFEKLRIAKGGNCAICSEPLATPPVRRGTTHAPCIDHDHASGKLRGLLCMLCNRGLGNFKDSAEALQNASAYIIKYRCPVDQPTNKLTKTKHPRIVNVNFDVTQEVADALQALRNTGLFGNGVDCASVAEELLRKALLDATILPYWRST